MWRLQVGLLVSSPIFAEASKHHNAFRLIAVGLGIWDAGHCWLRDGLGLLEPHLVPHAGRCGRSLFCGPGISLHRSFAPLQSHS